MHPPRYGSIEAMAVSVVIPALNEAARVGAAVDAAFAGGAAEVLVVDGGSSDATREIAGARGARVLTAGPPRGAQSNAGAAVAQHDALVFVHADTLLPPGAAQAVDAALAAGAVFGGFRLAFIERARGLRWTERWINLRTRVTRCPWGDQAQFVRRDAFLDGGGFRQMPIMEDYELARRMRRSGAVAILPLTVLTSGRRFIEKGVLRTGVLNWLIVAAYRFGVSAETLAAWYRKR